MAFSPFFGDAVSLAEAIVSPKAGISIATSSYAGSNQAASFYDGSITALGIGSGIMLSTGSAMPPEGNTDTDYSTDFGLAGDSDLQPLHPPTVPQATTYDASSLTFTFEISDPNVRWISLAVVYATDDYPEGPDQEYSDVAAVFVNGALVGADSDRPALLGYFSEMPALQFTANSGAAIEYDGYTSVLRVVAQVTQGTNTVKIAIADRGDHMVDSSLFVSDLSSLSVGSSGMFRTVAGTDGANALDYSTSTDDLFYDLGNGNDVVRLGSGDNVVVLGGGDDRAYGLGGIDAISGDDANDLLRGGGGNDQIDGGAGNDTIRGESGADILRGGANDDQLSGGSGNDVIDGGTGIDSVTYETASAAIRASLASRSASGEGNDTFTSIENVTGSAFDDLITGNSGINVLNGGLGGDRLHGASGNDTLSGNDGNDQLYGGLGNDKLIGGAGVDRFLFDTALGSTNHDNITDFSVVDDSIVLDRTIFAAFTTNGHPASSAFFNGTTAHDADDRIIYDSASGNIYYDPDGSGAAAQILFAHVTAGTGLTNADFVIVS